MTLLKQIWAGAALLALAGPAQAQGRDCMVGIRTPAAGSYAEYAMGENRMRMAILGEETRAGKKLIRVEVSMTSKDGPMIMQMLVPGYPYEMNALEDLVIKAGNQPAMRMSGQMMDMMRSRMPKDAIAEACRNSKMVKVGVESITVPAGTFSTTHYRDESGGQDVWISEDLPFGLVRTKTSRGEEIVLIGRGSNARSQITETPQEMQMPGRP
jgi:hypothetical protein